MLAILAAVGVMPSRVLAQEKKPEKMVCGFERPTYGGFHTLNLHMENSQPAKVSANMRIDLDGLGWLTKQVERHGKDPREFGMSKLVGTYWTSQVETDLQKRENALKELQDPEEQITIQAILDVHRMDAAISWAKSWVDLSLSTVPNGGEQLFPKALAIQIPPLGIAVGLHNPDVMVVAASDADTLFEIAYSIEDSERTLEGTGPAPFVDTNDIGHITSFIQALQQGKDVTISVVNKEGDLLYYAQLGVGFNWNHEFSSLMSMSPKLRPKMLAYQQGDKTGCEKDACYLTTATVQTIGLSDDCWELETLRAYRDTTLSLSTEGKELIKEYYDIAPRIVARIQMRSDARTIWLRTYLFSILPTAIFVMFGWNDLALRSYKKMTMDLQTRF